CNSKFYQLGRQDEKTQEVNANQFSLLKIIYDNSPVTVLKSANQNTSTITPNNVLEFTNNLRQEISLTSPNSFLKIMTM
ncbi:11790_t:CDS:1, partial [Funneliformis mosseae]